MLAADPDLETRPCTPAFVDADPHQLADAALVDHRERIRGKDAALDVLRQELRRVVARETEAHLRQVVRAEREEVGLGRDLVGGERGARDLDHGADRVRHFDAGAREDVAAERIGLRPQRAQLVHVADERNHDLGDDPHLFSCDLTGRLHDRAHLHEIDLGIDDPEAAAAEPEHRIDLVKRVAAGAQLVCIHAHRRGERGDLLVAVRQELVQRRIEQADVHRQTVHDAEDREEVAALDGEQLRERALAARGIAGEDHLAYGADAFRLEEHVLGATETDAFGAELARDRGVVRRVGVAAHLQAAHAIRPRHQRLELAGLAARRDHRHAPEEDLAGRAVERDPVAAVHAVLADVEQPRIVADVELARAGDAGFSHAARDDRRVRRLAAAGGENAFRDLHAVDVLGRRLDADEDHLAAGGGGLGRLVGAEDDLTRRGARRRRYAARQQLLLGVRIDAGMEELVDRRRIDAADRGLAIDQALADHVHGDLHRRRRRTLAVPCLQHPQAAALDRELEVLHVAVVALEETRRLLELREAARHRLLERRIFARALLLADSLRRRPRDRRPLGELLRRANAGDDVLALRVAEEVAVEDTLAGRRVARERDAGRAVVAEVAEDHGLHVHRGAPLFRDVVELAVGDRARVVPRAEHGADRAPELLLRVVGKLDPEARANERFELVRQLAQVFGREIGVGLDAARVLLFLENPLERVLLLALRLQAEDDVAVHLNEAAIRVPAEARVLRLRDQPLDRLVVEAEVQDRVHHTRHRRARARSHRDEERIRGIAEATTDGRFDLREVGGDRGTQLRRILVAVRVVVRAHLGRDREAGRHRQPEARHLREVRTLPAEEVLHVGAAVGRAVAEEVDVARTRGGTLLSRRARRRGATAHDRLRPRTCLGFGDARPRARLRLRDARPPILAAPCPCAALRRPHHSHATLLPSGVQLPLIRRRLVLRRRRREGAEQTAPAARAARSRDARPACAPAPSCHDHVP